MLVKFHTVDGLGAIGYSAESFDSSGRQLVILNGHQWLLVDRSEVHGLREALRSAEAQLDAVTGPAEVPEPLDVHVLRSVSTGPGRGVTVEYLASDASLRDGIPSRLSISRWRHSDSLSGIRPAELPAIIDTLTDVARTLGVIS